MSEAVDIHDDTVVATIVKWMRADDPQSADDVRIYKLPVTAGEARLWQNQTNIHFGISGEAGSERVECLYHVVDVLARERKAHKNIRALEMDHETWSLLGSPSMIQGTLPVFLGERLAALVWA